jgi:two-component system sensor histidine kinase KdpD
VDSGRVSLAGAASHAAARIDDSKWQEHWAAMISIPLTQRRVTAAGHTRSYAEAAVMVAGSTLLGLAIAPLWGNSPVDLLYLPAVLGAAILGGLAPALFAALASVLAYNFFFTAPRGTFRIDSPVDIVTVVVLFIVALVTSQLAASVRRQAQVAAGHAARNATIAGLARRMLSCTSEQEICEVATAQFASVFGCNAVLVRGRPEPKRIASAPAAAGLTPSDIAAAALTLETGEPAGRGVAHVDPAGWQFHAVCSNALAIAAVGLARDDGAPPIEAEQRPLLDNLLDQVALALERARLEQEARDFATIRERDRIRAALLASIGEDLTPVLKSIGSSVRALRRSGSSGRAELSSIASEASRLERYVANLVELGPVSDQAPLSIGGVTIDLFQRAVMKDGREVHLTPKEFAVLAELAKHPGRVLSHDHLLRAVWGPAQERQPEYLRVAVRALRQKLERNPARPEMIVNEPAVGYRLVAGRVQ